MKYCNRIWYHTVFTSQVYVISNGQEVSFENTENGTHIYTETETPIQTNLQPSDKTFLFHDASFPDDKFEPEISVDTKSSDIQPGANSLSHKGQFKPIAQEIFQKFNPASFVKPLQEKLNKVKESFVHPNNPVYNGVHFWTPDQIWEKIHETGHHFFTGEERTYVCS